MKKTLTFVILSLVTVSLFSGYYNYLSGSNISTSQTSTMTVVIEATSDILNCGISSTFDPSKSDLGLTDLSTKSFDPVINTTSQNWSYKGKIDELYVWWQIYSSNKLIAFLQGNILRFKVKSLTDIYRLEQFR